MNFPRVAQNILICISAALYPGSASSQNVALLPEDFFPIISNDVNIRGTIFEDGVCYSPQLPIDQSEAHLLFIDTSKGSSKETISSEFFTLTLSSEEMVDATFITDKGLCHFTVSARDGWTLRVLEGVLNLETKDFDGRYQDNFSLFLGGRDTIFVPQAFVPFKVSSDPKSGQFSLSGLTESKSVLVHIDYSSNLNSTLNFIIENQFPNEDPSSYQTFFDLSLRSFETSKYSFHILSEKDTADVVYTIYEKSTDLAVSLVFSQQFSQRYKNYDVLLINGIFGTTEWLDALRN